MLLKIILALVLLINGAFALSFIRDLAAHKKEALAEPGNPLVMGVSQFVIYLLSTFGISDFAIGASLYPRAKWVDDKNLPGTLNTACVIPVAVMALAYISSINVGLATLIVPIVAQVLGAYASPRFVVKLPKQTIQVCIAIGLLVAALIILMGKVGIYPPGGDATSLDGPKLVLLGVLSLVYGALNNIGIGSYALTMATVYALGMNPNVAFPIMMGACTFSVPIGSMQFIKLQAYSRKITFFSATFGVLGVLVAAFVVKSMQTAVLQWVVLAVILYSAVSMILSVMKSAKTKK